MNDYDVLVVGAGISGATLAERYANVLGKKVLVVEKRKYIGGNCFDYIDKSGVLMPKFGPHYFHTNIEKVWNYVNKFTKWRRYEHRVLSCIDGKTLAPVPVNINTVNKLLGLEISSSEEMDHWIQENQKIYVNPRNSEEAAINRVGEDLYKLLFLNYTKKQWGMSPKRLAALVLNRIPVRNNYDDRYFSDKYQIVPKYGYTQMFKNMLKNRKIKIKLNFDYEKEKYNLKINPKLFFYTGRIDSYFNYLHQKPLQYRSLRFELETLKQEFFQSRAQINYPNTEKFTRINEPKHATGQKIPVTTITREFPTWIGEPYYPVPSKENLKLYKKYQKLANRLKQKGIYFVGRLAEYKYFNMDQAFENALNIFEKSKKAFM